MFKKLLIAVDGSDLADKALAMGLGLAKADGAAVTILTATETAGLGVDGGFGMVDTGAIIVELEKAYAADAAKILAAATEKATAAGIAAETLHLPRHRPADAILETADARGTDLIVMGSHGRRGLDRLLLGSQANEVLTHAKIPVLIVK